MKISIDLTLCGTGICDAQGTVLDPADLFDSAKRHRQGIQYLMSIIKEWNEQCCMPSIDSSIQYSACDENQCRQAQVKITGSSENLPATIKIDRDYYESILSDYINEGIGILATTVELLNNDQEVHLVVRGNSSSPLVKLRGVAQPTGIEEVLLDEMCDFYWNPSAVAAAVVEYLEDPQYGFPVGFEIAGEQYTLPRLRYSKKVNAVILEDHCLEEIF